MRRGCGARDSGTNSAVSTIAARPIGTLTRKIARQPTASTSAPPSTGPSAMQMPNIAAPHADRPRALARVLERRCATIDIATGLSIAPPIACSTRNAISSSRLGARRTAATRARTAPGRSGTRAAGRAGPRSSRTASAGSPAPACRRRSSTAARDSAECKSSVDRRQRDVDDRRVEPDDEQAHRADAEDQQPRAGDPAWTTPYRRQTTVVTRSPAASSAAICATVRAGVRDQLVHLVEHADPGQRPAPSFDESARRRSPARRAAISAWSTETSSSLSVPSGRPRGRARPRRRT